MGGLIVDYEEDWIGCGGYYIGMFVVFWLDILLMGYLVYMCFYEFFCFVDGKVVEV